ncbi:TRAP transporter small permease subunit [Neptunomonas japonica]|uniref:TRAP transporter small permease protein n=1 Tax=Neptunomonas japonica JAMM 1380 TaxID=1441457 RepID=A0A7R6SWI8_9GAMM|nr:TRAP transporter small permease subunit [Neptunomonas japonica]BBB29762.1 TRAP dicarboxylate transporter DctQ subunit [Neptunomonas japonica JAMM 1380]
MYNAIQAYVRFIYKFNRTVGIFAMYLVLVLMGILLFSSISKGMGSPQIWVIEMAQFTMAAYYLLGGGYSMQMDAHVRMDVFYGSWSAKRQAITDAFTVLCLLTYLGMLLFGALSSTIYAVEYGQKNYSSWAPPLAPVKIIMTVGISLMLLQVLATFAQNVADAIGKPFDVEQHPEETSV